MQKPIKFAAKLFLCLIPITVGATTWNEPWQEQIIREADSFVKAQVLKNEDGKKLTLKLLKQIAGESVQAEFIVDGFFALRLSSVSGGHGPGFGLKPGNTYFLFLKKGKTGQTWMLPTPTSGDAELKENEVVATYRHSYHKALVSAELYEPSLAAIFQYLHSKPYDTKYIDQVIQAQLSLPPQNIADDNTPEQNKRFFEQHVALECFYYFGAGKDPAMLEPFLRSEGYHVQISAIRALSAINTDSAKKRLLEFIKGNGNGFAKVMAVWGLKRLDAKAYLPELKEYANKASEEETGFGGSIMDPRVATHFPGSVKAAIQELAEDWEPKKPKKEN